MDFLDTIDINKRKKRKCSRCKEVHLMPSGEIFCKKCRPKIKNLDTRLYQINANNIEEE